MSLFSSAVKEVTSTSNPTSLTSVLQTMAISALEGQMQNVNVTVDVLGKKVQVTGTLNFKVVS